MSTSIPLGVDSCKSWQKSRKIAKDTLRHVG